MSDWNIREVSRIAGIPYFEAEGRYCAFAFGAMSFSELVRPAVGYVVNTAMSYSSVDSKENKVNKVPKLWGDCLPVKNGRVVGLPAPIKCAVSA